MSLKDFASKRQAPASLKVVQMMALLLHRKKMEEAKLVSSADPYRHDPETRTLWFFVHFHRHSRCLSFLFPHLLATFFHTSLIVSYIASNFRGTDQQSKKSACKGKKERQKDRKPQGWAIDFSGFLGGWEYRTSIPTLFRSDIISPCFAASPSIPLSDDPPT